MSTYLTPDAAVDTSAKTKQKNRSLSEHDVLQSHPGPGTYCCSGAGEWWPGRFLGVNGGGGVVNVSR